MMPSQVTLGRMTVTDFVTQKIRERIVSGQYPPGLKLDQYKLVSEFGASIIPVRESLRQLESQGFIRLYPHRGAFVADVSLEEVQEIYLIRETLEEMATALAVPNLTPSDVDFLDDLVLSWHGAIDRRDYAHILDLSRQFSFAIYEASRKPLLCQTIRGLWDRSQIYRQLTVHMPGHLQRAAKNYRGILRHIKHKDAAAAATLIRKNLHQTVLSFMTYYSGKDMKQVVTDSYSESVNGINGSHRSTRSKGGTRHGRASKA